MKKIEIKQFSHAEVDALEETFGFLKIPLKHKLIRAEGENLEVSDGYHTMDELYEHRIELFIALCKALEGITYLQKKLKIEPGFQLWRSTLHADGTMFEGWFIMGIGKKLGKQMTYHLPLSYLPETNFVETLDRAPEWDGHSPADVLRRLKKL